MSEHYTNGRHWDDNLQAWVYDREDSKDARIADLNGLMDMMRENAVDREKRIAELEALVVRVEQQRNTMTAERDELESLLDEVWYSSLAPEPLDVWKAALRTRLPKLAQLHEVGE